MYSFNRMSGLEVTQSLPTVNKQQTETKDSRNVEEQIEALGNASCIDIWDNFNKMRRSHSAVFVDRYANLSQVMNLESLSLPPNKPCRHTSMNVKRSVFGQKDINFNE